EDAAGNVEELLLAVLELPAHLARLQAGDQRRMARRDAELAHLAGRDDHLRVAMEDLFLGTHDVAADRCHSLSHFVRSTGFGIGDWGFGKAGTGAGALPIPESRITNPAGGRLRR